MQIEPRNSRLLSALSYLVVSGEELVLFIKSGFKVFYSLADCPGITLINFLACNDLVKLEWAGILGPLFLDVIGYAGVLATICFSLDIFLFAA